MPSREFKWTKKRVQAAAFLAEDELSDEKIAAIGGVSRNTIAMWKLNPVFARRVNNLVSTWERKVMNSGIANKARRVRALNEIHNRQMQIVEERSTDAIFTAKDQKGQPIIPGGGTGLVVVQQRVLGYEDGKPVIAREGAFDHALSREIRATLDQAAQETGQCVEKHEILGRDGKEIELSITILDDIAARVRAARERATR